MSGIQQPTEISADEAIRIRGARVHNLQNLDVDIPRNRLVVVTGPSGSGKSSLAFDTLYAEGQRQYIESLSVYARQFLRQLERPDVDLIEGLQPTISVDQRAGATNPRSTVATVTEIYDYLRLLFARLGQATCYRCGQPIRQQTLEQILDALMALPEGTRVMVLAPMVRGRKGEHRDVLAAIRKAGLLRARVDGEVIDVETPPQLVAQRTHQIEAVVDRIVIREGVQARLAESIRLAVKHGDGLVIAAYDDRSSKVARALRDRDSASRSDAATLPSPRRARQASGPHGNPPGCLRCSGFAVADPRRSARPRGSNACGPGRTDTPGAGGLRPRASRFPARRWSDRPPRAARPLRRCTARRRRIPPRVQSPGG